MGRGEPGIGPSLTTQLLYFRQETGIRQRGELRGELPCRNQVNLKSSGVRYGLMLAWHRRLRPQGAGRSGKSECGETITRLRWNSRALFLFAARLQKKRREGLEKGVRAGMAALGSYTFAGV
jgi:hypothetical protein